MTHIFVQGKKFKYDVNRDTDQLAMNFKRTYNICYYTNDTSKGKGFIERLATHAVGLVRWHLMPECKNGKDESNITSKQSTDSDKENSSEESSNTGTTKRSVPCLRDIEESSQKKQKQLYDRMLHDIRVLAYKKKHEDLDKEETSELSNSHKNGIEIEVYEKQLKKADDMANIVREIQKVIAEEINHNQNVVLELLEDNEISELERNKKIKELIMDMKGKCDECLSKPVLEVMHGGDMKQVLEIPEVMPKENNLFQKDI